ncbi:YybH family protein [Agromyces sp. GXS1127]|uniref:YybH family protein n=1 Tax=Agromyces sp. GXS1127 TaxID=3424181 RepID=UPI003D313E96
MNDREEFLIWINNSLAPAERALFNGDAGPRRTTWSATDEVSVLGAWRNAVGRSELLDAFDDLAASFAACTDYAFELISFDVSGDMAYTVGYERISAMKDGTPSTFTVRSTQVYRREDGTWKVVHRHADTMA